MAGGRRPGAQDDLGRIISDKNATARALASGSGSGSFHARPFDVCWTIRGTLIVAVWAGFARLRGPVGDDGHGGHNVWAGLSVGNPCSGADDVTLEFVR
jgi:hypothetical protein